MKDMCYESTKWVRAVLEGQDVDVGLDTVVRYPSVTSNVMSQLTRSARSAPAAGTRKETSWLELCGHDRGGRRRAVCMAECVHIGIRCADMYDDMAT